jgi:hypothetical protein
MATDDDRFVANGPAGGVGVEGSGFSTNSSQINVGGHFEGNQIGVDAVCNNGPAILARGTNNNTPPYLGTVSVGNSGSGPGLNCTSGGEGIFAKGATNGVHGQTGTFNDKFLNDIGVWGENTGNVGGKVPGVGVGGTAIPAGQDFWEKPSYSVGVWGTTLTLVRRLADSGDGVLGDGQNGVHGRSRSPTDSGVWGENAGSGFGVSGSTNEGTGPKGTLAGVWGSNSGIEGAGVRGTSTAGYIGVLGEGGTGVLGQGIQGVRGTSAARPGFVPSAGVWGESTGGGIGVWGTSSGGGYGGVFGGDHAPLRLMPASTPGHPTSGRHEMGEFYVDSNGVLFYCLSAGTPGNWKTVHLV